MNKILNLIAFLLLGSGSLLAQKAWIVPEEFNPDDSVTIYVDMTKMDCQRLVDVTDPVYIWMWEPAEPIVGNGSWTASNPDLEMTRNADNPNIYSFKFVPTAFLSLNSSSDIYDLGFSFLAILSDGTGEGGGGCDEDKTEDLHVDAKPIPGCNTKFCQFPASLFWDDYFTFLYDNTLEDKASMDESVVGVENFAMYMRVIYDDGTKGTYVPYGDVINHPELSLIKDNSDGYYKRTFIFAQLLESMVVDGKTITDVEIQVMDRNYSQGPNSVSNGKQVVVIGCK
jgi:hypothetical protein